MGTEVEGVKWREKYLLGCRGPAVGLASGQVFGGTSSRGVAHGDC